MFNASKNTFITDLRPDRNFCSSSVVYCGKNSDERIFRLLIEFDLSRLPAHISLESAILALHVQYDSEMNEPGIFTPYLIKSGWDENQVTWDTQPRFDTSIAGSARKVQSSGYHSWDISDIVLQWISNGGKNHGILIKSEENEKNDRKGFYSSVNRRHYSCRPYLEISYDLKPSVVLDSRNTVSISAEHETGDELRFTAWRNTSVYSTCSFFAENNGDFPAEIFVQISPDMETVISEPPVFTLEPGMADALIPRKYGAYSRLAFKSASRGRGTSLKIWFQAQV